MQCSKSYVYTLGKGMNLLAVIGFWDRKGIIINIQGFLLSFPLSMTTSDSSKRVYSNNLTIILVLLYIMFYVL